MASTPPQTEKPFHYTYLKEFRVNQCPLFLQHKCTQHRPFTCFHWHFSNQRRRRPVRRRDGTFNYSADAYCSKYDETTGICPDGDDCAFIHRNTGDTERRYHLRYYKTGTCIHETDSRGNCVKNGPHCAFAHGSTDLRPPVYDIREQQCNEQVQQNQSCPIAEQPPMQDSINLTEKIVNDDPKWQDANYVLANYKTELCKRPPRLCRQGYACPQYHNAKDRRRNPKKYKYRSSPCPIVKQGDDWKDPSCCDKGDSCQYCHTRTEQQFHPEIYKSTKCHDMTQTGYCPRGPFCAFAHVEQEIRIVEDQNGGMGGQSAQADVDNDPRKQRNSYNSVMNVYETPSALDSNHMWSDFARNFGQENEYSRSMPNQSMLSEYAMSRSFPTCPSPVAKPRTTSLSNGKGDHYSKAPGSERISGESPFINNYAAPSAWTGSAADVTSQQGVVGRLNSDAVPFYPPDETVDSVVGNALDDLEIDDGKHDANNLHEAKMKAGSVWAQQSFPMSDPVNIPHDAVRANVPRNPMPSISPTSLANAFSTEPMPGMTSSVPYVGAFPASVGTPGSLPGSIMSVSLGSAAPGDLEHMQMKCRQWEESWNQAKVACDAWKREATEANERARIAEERSNITIERCRILEQQLQAVMEQKDFPGRGGGGDGPKGCAHLHQSYSVEELGKFTLAQLQELQGRYKGDLTQVEQMIWDLLVQSQK